MRTRRFRCRFVEDSSLFECDLIYATTEAWREMPESAEAEWLVVRPSRRVIALRLVLPPEICDLIDDGTAAARYESDLAAALSSL